jgi:hypothetical protein
MAHKTNYRNRIEHYNRFTQQPSRMNGKRGCKSSHPNDFIPGPGGHTKPVVFKTANDTGVRNPTRRRHAQTKEMHRRKRLGI